MSDAKVGDQLLPYLETFAKAAEVNNFTVAAQALGLTQSAVSQRIQALEGTLRRSLFERGGGRVLLSEAGRTLYEYSQRILELDRAARQAITGQTFPLTGDLLLSASSVAGEHLLPDLLRGFQSKFPKVRIHAGVSDSDSVVRQVETGEAHLGLLGRRVPRPHLEYKLFAHDNLALVVPAGHPLAKRRRGVGLRQLEQLPMILRKSGSGLRHALDQALERVGRCSSDLTIAMELGSNEAIKAAVHRGVGVALLSDRAVEQETTSGTLVTLALTDLDCNRDIHVVRDTRRVLPAPARAFATFLDSHAES